MTTATPRTGPKPARSSRWSDRHWRLRRLGGLAVLAMLPGLSGGFALAYWSTSDSSNPAAAVADTLPTGATPAGTAAGAGTIAVIFPRASTTAGREVTDYLVRRYDAATGGAASAAFACSWPVGATLACADTTVPNGGLYYYTDTPRIAGTTWVGAESARSGRASTDVTAPVVSVTWIDPPANGNGYQNTSPVTVTLGATDAGGSAVASITYWVDAGSHSTVAATTATVSVAGDGAHTVSFTGTDGAGNTGSVATQAVTIDTVAPGAATISSYPSPVNLANRTAVALSGTAEAAATVTVTIADNGSAHTVTRTATASGAGAWSVTGVDVSSLTDGPVTFRATAADAAGNIGAAATTAAVKDTVAPAVAITTATDPVTATNVAAAAAAGTVEAGASVAVAVTGASGQVSPQPTVSGSGWSVSAVSLASLADGTITYTVTATDSAGNTATATRTATKDTSAPTVSALAVGPAGNASTGAIRQGGSYYVYANATDPAPGSAVTLTANASSLSTGQTAVPLTAAGGPFTAGGVTYSYRSAARTANNPLAAGAKTITVTGTDTVGNAATANGSVTVDNTAPTPAAVLLANRTGGVAGKPEVNDTITFTYSEQLDPATLATGWSYASTPDLTGATVTFADSPSGSGTNKDNDSVAVATPGGGSLGTVINLQGGLVPTQAGSYAFAATLHYAVTSGQTVLAVTLTGLNAGGTTVGTATTSTTFTWTPATGPTDLAGNPVTGSVNSTARPF
jgi:hypothetical protein